MRWTVFGETLVKLGSPFDDAQIATALAGAAESHEERHEVDDYESVRDWLRENDSDAPLRTLLSLSWSGMYSSTVSVALLDAGDRGLLVRRDDTVPERDWLVLAAVTSRSPFVLMQTVRRLDAAALLAETTPDRIAVFRPLPVRATLEWCGVSRPKGLVRS